MDAATRVYGVVGDPVAHSLSPTISERGHAARRTVNAVYVALHAKTLKDLLACVRDIPIRGPLSITMPYKEAIVLRISTIPTPYTTKIGACNTVVRAQDRKLYGFNTDTAGVVRPLEQENPAGKGQDSSAGRRRRRPRGRVRPEGATERKSTFSTAARRRRRNSPTKPGRES